MKVYAQRGDRVRIDRPLEIGEFIKKGTIAVITEVDIQQPSQFFKGTVWYSIELNLNTKFGVRKQAYTLFNHNFEDGDVVKI